MGLTKFTVAFLFIYNSFCCAQRGNMKFRRDDGRYRPEQEDDGQYHPIGDEGRYYPSNDKLYVHDGSGTYSERLIHGKRYSSEGGGRYKGDDSGKYKHDPRKYIHAEEPYRHQEGDQGKIVSDISKYKHSTLDDGNGIKYVPDNSGRYRNGDGNFGRVRGKSRGILGGTKHENHKYGALDNDDDKTYVFDDSGKYRHDDKKYVHVEEVYRHKGNDQARNVADGSTYKPGTSNDANDKNYALNNSERNRARGSLSSTGTNKLNNKYDAPDNGDDKLHVSGNSETYHHDDNKSVRIRGNNRVLLRGAKLDNSKFGALDNGDDKTYALDNSGTYHHVDGKYLHVEEVHRHKGNDQAKNVAAGTTYKPVNSARGSLSSTGTNKPNNKYDAPDNGDDKLHVSDNSARYHHDDNKSVRVRGNNRGTLGGAKLDNRKFGALDNGDDKTYALDNFGTYHNVDGKYPHVEEVYRNKGNDQAKNVAAGTTYKPVNSARGSLSSTGTNKPNNKYDAPDNDDDKLHVSGNTERYNHNDNKFGRVQENNRVGAGIDKTNHKYGTSLDGTGKHRHDDRKYVHVEEGQSKIVTSPLDNGVDKKYQLDHSGRYHQDVRVEEVHRRRENNQGLAIVDKSKQIRGADDEHVPDAFGKYHHDDRKYVHDDRKYIHDDKKYVHVDEKGERYRHITDTIVGDNISARGYVDAQNGVVKVTPSSPPSAIANERKPKLTVPNNSKCSYENQNNNKIIRQKDELEPDKYHYLYESENCMYAEEMAVLYDEDKGSSIKKTEGIFYYVGPDKVKYTVTYTADENGFIPSGAHIPTPPPTPVAILRSLEYQKQIKNKGAL